MADNVSPLEQKWPMYTSPLVVELLMTWVSSLFGFILFDYVFSGSCIIHLKTGAYVDTQKCPKVVLGTMNKL